MKTSLVRYLSVRDCPFTFGGKNLAEMRRAELKPLAHALKVEANTKNDMLINLVAKLKMLGAEKEVEDLVR